MLILYLKTAHHFVSISLKSKSNPELTEQNALANRALTCLPILLCVRLWGETRGWGVMTLWSGLSESMLQKAAL